MTPIQQAALDASGPLRKLRRKQKQAKSARNYRQRQLAERKRIAKKLATLPVTTLRELLASVADQIPKR